MDHNDDVATTASFWDDGSYKRVTKRITDGAKLCDELIKMLGERASIEKTYSKALTQWSDRWTSKVEKVREYGTLKQGWLGVVDECTTLAQVHSAIQTRLDGPLSEKIKEFQKQHYPKSFMHHKSYKRATSAFEKAQGPWTKRKAKVLKHQKAYNGHLEASQEFLRAANATGVDSEATKLRANAEKEKKEAAKSREKLRERVREMHQYADIYRREMCLEFERCQEDEGVRIQFFKNALYDYHKMTDVSASYDEAHVVLRGMIDDINHTQDLQKYDRELGPGMPMLLPDENGDFKANSSAPAAASPAASAPPAARTPSPPPSYSEPPPQPASVDSNQFHDVGGSTSSLTMPGMRMRALYDYTGANHDELSFAFDDVIIVLPQPAEIESGWIKGQLESGQVGIFPGNYAEAE